MIGRLANRDYPFSHFVENLYDETDRLMVIHKNELDVSRSRTTNHTLSLSVL